MKKMMNKNTTVKMPGQIDPNPRAQAQENIDSVQKFQPKTKRASAPCRRWSAAEDKFLKRNYGSMTCAQLGNILNRTAHAVSQRARTIKCNGVQTAATKPLFLKPGAFQDASKLPTAPANRPVTVRMPRHLVQA
jgi:hypothetical protein